MKIVDISMWNYFFGRARVALKHEKNPDNSPNNHNIALAPPVSAEAGFAPAAAPCHSVRLTADHYREICDLSPVGFATFSRLGNFIDLNLATASLLGREREDIRGKSLSGWLANGQLKLFIRHLNAVFLSRQKQSVELLIRDDSHNHRIIRLESIVVTSAGGSAASCNSVITSAVNACQSEVNDRMRLAAQVFDCANESIVMADADNRVLMVNPAFTRTTGYSADEVVGKDLRRLLSDGVGPDSLPSMACVVADGTRYSRERMHRHKSGNLYAAWENHSTVCDLDGRVFYHVLVFSDISQLKTEVKKSIHLAHHDVLTGLPNRLLFNARLEQSLQLAKRHKTHLALLFLDIDRFKLINDTLGHECGDMLLKEVATRIRHCVREQDTVARLGGDEFVVLLSEINHEQEAANLADKILRAIHHPIALEWREVTTSASIGISLFPRDASTSTELVKAADVAMYCAKARGRHKYGFFTRELTLRAEQRTKMETVIRDNLASDGFFLSYQPQFDLATGKMVGVEALLRWEPSIALTCPAKVISIAEESSLIFDLDLWVLRAACEQASNWQRSGLPLIPVAINFSALNLMRGNILVDNLSTKVRQILDEFSLPAEWIQLEVTESILHPGSRAIEGLESLKSLGVGLAIDDFGKGYSSLSTLRDLPVDRIKIDRSFIQAVPDNKRDAGVAKAIIAMAHNMNLKITAEGVESDAQWHFLRNIGCDEGQGFRFGRPAAAALIPAYFDRVMMPQANHQTNEPR